MRNLGSKRFSWLLAVAFGLVGSSALASGSVRTVPLEEAVHQASAVLVVERAEPFRRDVQLWRQPRQRRGSAREPLGITYLSFVIRETLFVSTSSRLVRLTEVEVGPPVLRSRFMPSEERGLFRFEAPRQPMEQIWLISSGDTQNIELARMSIEKGVSKIPIYERLDGGLMPEAIVAGEPYILLAHADPEYQSYEGVGDWGLLDIKKQEAVERILRTDRHAPALPEVAALEPDATRSPDVDSDADILEAVFRYQIVHNDSAIQKSAGAYCLQVGNGAELAPEFMRRFRGMSKVKPASGCATTIRDRCDRVVVRQTKRPALRFGIDSIRQISSDTVVVVGEYIEDCESIAYYEYVLRRYDSSWIIIRRAKIGAT